MTRLSDDGIVDQDRLFACLAEQVKTPIMQMAFMAESMDAEDASKLTENKAAIIESSQAALRMIDGFC